jgi:hypothetical protein
MALNNDVARGHRALANEQLDDHVAVRTEDNFCMLPLLQLPPHRPRQRHNLGGRVNDSRVGSRVGSRCGSCCGSHSGIRCACACDTCDCEELRPQERRHLFNATREGLRRHVRGSAAEHPRSQLTAREEVEERIVSARGQLEELQQRLALARPELNSQRDDAMRAIRHRRFVVRRDERTTAGGPNRGVRPHLARRQRWRRTTTLRVHRDHEHAAAVAIVLQRRDEPAREESTLSNVHFEVAERTACRCTPPPRLLASAAARPVRKGHATSCQRSGVSVPRGHFRKQARRRMLPLQRRASRI